MTDRSSLTREYPLRPIAAVGLVVWKGPSVLLIKRGKPPRAGHWSLPGGAQELGETVEQTGRREVLEEANITVGPLGLIEIVDSITYDDQQRILYHYTLMDFWCDWVDGNITPGGDVLETRWVLPAELQAYALWSETERIIAKAGKLRN